MIHYMSVNIVGQNEIQVKMILTIEVCQFPLSSNLTCKYSLPINTCSLYFRE